MTVTTSVTKIELSADERNHLRKALEILKEVKKVINNKDMDYVVGIADMDLYNRIYDEINRIEEYVMIE